MNPCIDSAKVSSDLDLVERLRLSLSPAYMTRKLTRHWPFVRQRGLSVEDCRVLRTHRSDDDGFVLEFAVRLGSGDAARTEHLFGELCPLDPKAHYREVIRRLRSRKRRQIRRHKETQLIAYLDDPGLVLRFPGLDERLPGLSLIHNPTALRSLLEESYNPNGSTLHSVSVARLGHRLGKRYVARLQLEFGESAEAGRGTHTVIAKLYKRSSARETRIVETSHALRASGLNDESLVSVPEINAYIPEPQILLMQDVPGKLLSQMPASELPGAVFAAGRALARLHGCDVRITHVHTAMDELALLEGWVDLVTGVFPDCAALFAPALSRIAQRLADAEPWDPVLSHRDFYEKQIIVSGPRTYLIDFDTVAMADRALDVGNFLAHVDLNDSSFAVTPEILVKRFLCGYQGPTDGGFEGRVGTYRSAALLRLACIHALRSGGRTVAERLLARVL